MQSIRVQLYTHSEERNSIKLMLLIGQNNKGNSYRFEYQTKIHECIQHFSANE